MVCFYCLIQFSRLDGSREEIEEDEVLGYGQ